ncbi:MAG TPA: hypothetical protein VMI06_06720 [Terriglobia bacterium]|nr:hypothetical protein [Terriglobia bacterium]
MKVSRRSFLGYASFLPAACFGREPAKTRARIRRSAAVGRKDCLLLTLSCTLGESLEGYRRCLTAAGAPFEVSCRETAASARLIVLPAAAMTDLSQARWLRRRIEQGATALVESGGAFLSQSEFRVQQLLLASHFGLPVAEPVQLWSTSDPVNRPPYVDFTWPVEARIRDFSRVVPIHASPQEAIALQGTRIVGLRRRLGAGTIVFLGSPAGPHLLARDREAHRWFERFLRDGTRPNSDA